MMIYHEILYRKLPFLVSKTTPIPVKGYQMLFKHVKLTMNLHWLSCKHVNPRPNRMCFVDCGWCSVLELILYLVHKQFELLSFSCGHPSTGLTCACRNGRSTGTRKPFRHQAGLLEARRPTHAGHPFYQRFDAYAQGSRAPQVCRG